MILKRRFSLSKRINVKKQGIKCPYCDQIIGEDDTHLEYETISLEYTKGGKRKISSTHQIIYCNKCGKIISIVPHRVTPL